MVFWSLGDNFLVFLREEVGDEWERSDKRELGKGACMQSLPAYLPLPLTSSLAPGQLAMVGARRFPLAGHLPVRDGTGA